MSSTPAQHPQNANLPTDPAVDLRARIASITASISAACQRSNRSADEVSLVAVSKTVPVEKIRMALEAGVRVLGENRVQEAADKIEELRAETRIANAEWHFIGHLQSNKARRAAELFSCIHSVDSLKLAERLDRAAAELNRRMPIFLEVNLGGEASKSGLGEKELLPAVEGVGALQHIDLRGLMTVPPYLEKPEEVRPFFAGLAHLRDEACEIVPSCRELSMGMSHDFEVAVEEGATFVRIGTAIFGARS
jgi:pyridoxal phosphate enzyme (YggS family)